MVSYQFASRYYLGSDTSKDTGWVNYVCLISMDITQKESLLSTKKFLRDDTPTGEIVRESLMAYSLRKISLGGPNE